MPLQNTFICVAPPFDRLAAYRWGDTSVHDRRATGHCHALRHILPQAQRCLLHTRCVARIGTHLPWSVLMGVFFCLLLHTHSQNVALSLQQISTDTPSLPSPRTQAATTACCPSSYKRVQLEYSVAAARLPAHCAGTSMLTGGQTEV